MHGSTALKQNMQEFMGMFHQAAVLGGLPEGNTGKFIGACTHPRSLGESLKKYSIIFYVAFDMHMVPYTCTATRDFANPRPPSIRADWVCNCRLHMAGRSQGQPMIASTCLRRSTSRSNSPCLCAAPLWEEAS